jgi:hypothetical protein
VRCFGCRNPTAVSGSTCGTGSRTTTDFRVRTLMKMFPEDPPMFIERTPMGYHDIGNIRGELAGAGFTRAPPIPARCPVARPRRSGSFKDCRSEPRREGRTPEARARPAQARGAVRIARHRAIAEPEKHRAPPGWSNARWWGTSTRGRTATPATTSHPA